MTMTNREWFKQAQFGMMVHWGLYALPAGEWKGHPDWKSTEEVIRLKTHLRDRGINYLLNVGPDYLGRIPAPCVEILKAVGASSGTKRNRGEV